MNGGAEETRPSEPVVLREELRAYGDLRDRTKAFAVQIVKFYCGLYEDPVKRILAGQVLRSGTSIGAHYREAYRARSVPEFISKVETLLQELDETIYWIELLVEAELATKESSHEVMNEANQLMSIFVASVKTAKQRPKR